MPFQQLAKEGVPPVPVVPQSAKPSVKVSVGSGVSVGRAPCSSVGVRAIAVSLRWRFWATSVTNLSLSPGANGANVGQGVSTALGVGGTVGGGLGVKLAAGAFVTSVAAGSVVCSYDVPQATSPPRATELGKIFKSN